MRSRQPSKKMTRLNQAIGIRYELDVAMFERAKARIARIESKISTLREQLSSRLTENHSDIAETRAAFVYRQWIEQEIRGLNLELARGLVEKENARILCAQSTARHETAKRLLKD